MNRHPDLPPEVPLHTVDLGGKDLTFTGGEDFWTQVKDVIAAGDFTAALDQALENHSVPRVWLLLHEIGQEALSAAAVLGFAQILSGREQAVLVLDCDDWACSLTQWAGRRECEGWIDMVRTGNSVLTAGHELPFAGGRKGYLVGVGSFTPTDVTAEEIEALLARLRRQADDILLVAPADDLGRMWAGHAHIRLLCWDQSAEVTQSLRQLATSFAESGTPLTGMVGLGEPRDPQVDVSFGAKAPQSMDEAPILDDEEVPHAATEVKYIGDDSPAGHRKTSGVFWGAAGVFLVLITVAFIYYWQFVRTSEQEGGRPEVALIAAGSTTVESADQSEEAGQFEEIGQFEEVDLTGMEKPETEADVAGPDSLVVPIVEIVTASAPTVEEKDSVVPETSVEQPAAGTAEATAFDMAPYLVPVGADGWAMHVYSFADSTQSRQQLDELARRGFQAEQQAVQIPEKGRYYRIFVGSFPSKSAARQAKDPLLAELREDWAQIVKF